MVSLAGLAYKSAPAYNKACRSGAQILLAACEVCGSVPGDNRRGHTLQAQGRVRQEVLLATRQLQARRQDGGEEGRGEEGRGEASGEVIGRAVARPSRGGSAGRLAPPGKRHSCRFRRLLSQCGKRQECRFPEELKRQECRFPEELKRQECRFSEWAVATGETPVVPVRRQDGGFPS